MVWQVPLEELDVSWNSITQSGTACILSALCSNSTLQSLSLAWNRLGAPGCAALATMLSQNSRLQRLDLTNCGIIATHCNAIAEGVRRNTGLQVVKLDQNALGHAGAKTITHVLQERHIRYSITETDARMSGTGGLEDAMVATFDECTPSGRWCLHLADPKQRTVALKLVEYASMFDGECWRNERLNGRRFGYTGAWKLPDTGKLELDFVLLEPENADMCGTMEEKDFDALCNIFQNLRYTSECGEEQRHNHGCAHFCSIVLIHAFLLQLPG
jgi:hypothetical protein